ncbi:BTB/POZ domain-containing protein [Dorcoceras hygrometricum]|uniref:BTB/POZ domain-containing protein n=1 Tax=Dorcoceras hygrometricum TaxID=472368 RepID=A0A2Z7DGH0_9LAMI|nr:BTB/POZ domain-containing protein [Dorcoceras hygrometricum]
MAAKQAIECHTWRPKARPSSEVQFQIGGSVFNLDKELLAAKSEKLAKLLKESPHENPSQLLRDIPADQDSLEIVERFCQGYEINLSTENVVRVTCVSHYLGMTESHCPNNLLNKTIVFLEQEIIPSWSKSIKALKTTENVLQEALHLGLVEYCVESIVSKVLEDPRLLGEPIKDPVSGDDSDENDNGFRQASVRRKLFDHDWKSEDLKILSLRLYEYIISTMLRRKVPQEYVAANICEYAKKWLFCKRGDDASVYAENSQREIVEVLEALLPHQKGVLPCTFLFGMLHFAVVLGAKPECKNGLEIRIGNQLDHASVKDLLIPSQGYSKDERYDTGCVTRILKNFYNNYTGPGDSGLLSVAELIDEFLAEISADIDLKMTTFMEFADMAVAASAETPRTSDGIYRAIDIYLDKHRYLTESQKEEICRFLDCNKMTREACEHAAQNNKLPTRVVVQVLFIGQLKLRDEIAKEVKNGGGLLKVAEAEEDVVTEMEEIGNKVLALERECSAMRRQISCKNVKTPKKNIWKEMKRKLGCATTSIHECDCHVKKKKKVHPK